MDGVTLRRRASAVEMIDLMKNYRNSTQFLNYSMI
jgi:hypothetical protein